MKLPSCPRTLIINTLRKHPDGLTLTSIAQLTGLHRHTATKYIYELKGAGIIIERDVGSAKLCHLKDGLKKSEEKKLIERLNGSGKKKERMKASGDAFFLKSSAGQVQLLSLFVLLFLVPATVIIAQNATINTTSEGNLVLDQFNISASESNENPQEIPIDDNQNLTDYKEQINITLPELLNETNETFSGENITEVTAALPSESTKENETILPDAGIFANETFENQMQDNPTEQETQNLTNETIAEPIAEPPVAEILEPVLEVRIVSPDRITRGEEFDISAVVKNSGNGEAKNVRIYWEIPSGFKIVSGETEESCGSIPPDSECARNLTISSSLLTDTGRSEFKILVKYEK